MNISGEIYNEEYYRQGLGEDYNERPKWEQFFRYIAKRIVEDFNPNTIIDFGCAYGYLVHELRKLGVDAWGVDISSYAISKASENVKPYLRVASVLDGLPQELDRKYDMAICIEMIEHLYEEDGLKALKKMSQYSDMFLFSSTSKDFEEESHFNVQQNEYWARKMAELNFYKVLNYNADYISKDAFIYKKNENLKMKDIVTSYEHKIRNIKGKIEKEQITNVKLNNDINILREQAEKDKTYYENEMKRLTEEIKSYDLINHSFNNDISFLREELKNKEEYHGKHKERLEEEIEGYKEEIEGYKKEIELNVNKNKELIKKHKLINESYNNERKEKEDLMEKYNSLSKDYYNIVEERDSFYQENLKINQYINDFHSTRGYRALSLYYRIRDFLLPKNTYRRAIVKKIFKKQPKKQENYYKGDIDREKNLQNYEKKDAFYTEKEIIRQEWCRNNPIEQNNRYSIVVPLYNTPSNIFKEMIDSVINQIYPKWELCLANAGENKSELREIISEYADDRIKYIELSENYGISGNTVKAIEIATGEYICFLDHDDMIPPNAIYEYEYYLQNKDSNVDFFYSDKDMINEDASSRMNPLLKPGYSPEMMLSANYFTHFCVVRRELIPLEESFDSTTDGAQDWDIYLKVMEKTNNIVNIPLCLYHWRIISTSVASGAQAKPYVFKAQLKALNGHISRKGWLGEIYFNSEKKDFLRVKWNFKKDISYKIILLMNEEFDIEPFENTIAFKKNQVSLINSFIEETKAETLLFIDMAEITNIPDEESIKELIMWAMHPEIAFVFPKLVKKDDIISCGFVYDEDNIMDLFGDKDISYYGEMGSAWWYRNVSSGRGTAFAIETKKLRLFDGYKGNLATFYLTYNAFFSREKGYRNIYNPFATVCVDKVEKIEDVNDKFNESLRCIVNFKDIYFNQNCRLDVKRKSLTNQKNEKKSNRIPVSQYSKDAIILASLFDFKKEDLIKNRKIVESNYNDSIKTMIWFLPEFDYVFYAGLYTIFRTIQYLKDNYDINPSFAFLSGLSPNQMMERISKGFPGLKDCKAFCLTNYEDLLLIGKYDASVCTLWTTAYYSLKFNKVKRKFYFIQDYEPLFYPAGSTYAQTEATYRFGFDGICNTEGLKQVYETEYGEKAVTLDPSVDRTIFYPNKSRIYDKEKYMMFFYGRPGHSRNGFELGIQALKKLKNIMGEKIRIVTAGADYDLEEFGLDGIIENLGRLKIEETGNLYRNCDIGLVMMFTRHPSYLPYELMGCGCPVISNYNSYTTWFLKDKENCWLAEPSATHLAETIRDALLNPIMREKISNNALKDMENNNKGWDDSLRKVADFINGNN